MDHFAPHEMKILQQAAERAQRLLDQLVRGSEFGIAPSTPELADYPDFPSPGLLAEGEELLRTATDSARRLSESLAAASDAAGQRRIPHDGPLNA